MTHVPFLRGKKLSVSRHPIPPVDIPALGRRLHPNASNTENNPSSAYEGIPFVLSTIFLRQIFIRRLYGLPSLVVQTTSR